MAISRILLQGLNAEDLHAASLRTLLSDRSAATFIISSAYVRAGGIDEITDLLKNIADKVTIYVGVANGVTSSQALKQLIACGISPFAVNMGTLSRIFHPKLYAAFSSDYVKVIIGSANLTFSGLNGNIEISTELTLSRQDASDNNNIIMLEKTFSQLHTQYPDNIKRIGHPDEVDALAALGYLENEDIKRHAVIVGSAQTSPDSISLVPPFPILSSQKITKKTKRTPLAKTFTPRLALGEVWRGKGLKERDLNIPTGKNTNPTGSMFFKKGLMENIDQRHYFRDVVFANLHWFYDENIHKKHLERATAQFEIVIDGISYGNHRLKLTHDSRTDSETYRQNNSVTQIHWGNVKDFIAQPALLGKYVTLYHLGDDRYQLVIA